MNVSLEDFNDLIKDDANCPHDDLLAVVLEEDLMNELLETGSVTLHVDNREFVVSVKIEEVLPI